MSPNPHLPFELQESILSHLADSLDYVSYRPTLANCALVCHAWRSIVQPWMFTKVRIRPDLMKLDNIAKFFGASSPSHHLSKHIKMITISSVVPRYQAATTPSFSAMLGAMDAREMFRLFNNVEHIYTNLSLESLSKEDITLLSQFGHLRKMELVFTRLSSLYDLVSSFPALTHLKLHPVLFSDSEAVQVQVPALKLQRLGIFLDNDARGFPVGMRLNAPGLEHLMLMWIYIAKEQRILSVARNVLDSIPLENIKTLNLDGCSWHEGDGILGKSWCFLNAHSAHIQWLFLFKQIISSRPDLSHF
jgi:hypothetical protein